MSSVPTDRPDITIVVTAHGRQWPLQRLLTYLSAFEGWVIVADSSPAPFAGIAAFPKVDYRHMPGIGFYEKLTNVYASVTTTYLIDTPDDDFPLLSGIAAGLARLKAMPQAVACGGYILTFQVANGTPQLGIDNAGANVGPQLAAQDTAATESVPARIARLFDDVVMPNHAILRRDAALRALGIIAAAPHLRPVRFWDKILLLAMGAQGPIAWTDAVLQIRSLGERLINAPVYPPELEREVDADQLGLRLGPDGGALAAFVAEAAQIDPDAARASVLAVAERYAQGYPPGHFETRMARTVPLAQAAAARQSEDIGRAFAAIARYPGP